MNWAKQTVDDTCFIVMVTQAGKQNNFTRYASILTELSAKHCSHHGMGRRSQNHTKKGKCNSISVCRSRCAIISIVWRNCRRWKKRGDRPQRAPPAIRTNRVAPEQYHPMSISYRLIRISWTMIRVQWNSEHPVHYRRKSAIGVTMWSSRAST